MKVVVIGGGFCGALVAKGLEKIDGIKTVLIDKKSYYEYQPSLPKVIFKPSYLSKIRIEYSSIIKNSEIIIETVEEITKDYVKTSKNKISYDILVISTGIDYPIFLKNKNNVYVIKNGEDALEISKKIQNSNHVLIVGGGVIGVEVAGEIIEKFPEIKLTVVHSSDIILQRMPKDCSAYIIKYLKKNRVVTIFDDRVVENKNGIFITKKGKKISTDLCIWCAGIKWNPYFMKKFPKVCFSKNDSLNVNRYLQLKGFNNIFIGGDLTSISEEKTGRKSKLHSNIIVKNIKNILNERPLKAYKTGTSPMVISLGNWRGIIYFKFVIPGLFTPGILKWLIQWWFIRSLK
jgi:NADH dehydrogenase FAD-containing subunit